MRSQRPLLVYAVAYAISVPAMLLHCVRTQLSTTCLEVIVFLYSVFSSPPSPRLALICRGSACLLRASSPVAILLSLLLLDIRVSSVGVCARAGSRDGYAWVDSNHLGKNVKDRLRPVSTFPSDFSARLCILTLGTVLS